MLGLGLQINKNLGGAGGRPPFYSDLTFYSKDRTGSVVNNKIEHLVNGELLYNPLTDVIYLEKYTDRGTETNGSVEAGTLHTWETVTIPTIIDDVIDDLTFKIVKDFDDFQAVNNGLTATDYYIMANDIDCRASQTMNETVSSGDYDAGVTYTALTVITWTDANRYIRTPYVGNYVAGKTPEDTDTDGQKYWEEYNYTGFWINEFYGTFSGNGFELQNCYVNKTGNNVAVFSRLIGGKLSNIGVTGNVIGYNNNNGGLTGSCGSFSVITNSYSTCSVVGYLRYNGGLIGYSISSKIINSYSFGDIFGYGIYNGGLIGRLDYSEVINSYSTGNVAGLIPSYNGGLAGFNLDSIITNSYWDKDTSGQTTSSGGIGLTTTQMKLQASFVDWDFNNVWSITDSYPYLSSEDIALANPISNSKIVNNYDGYIILPSEVKITVDIEGTPTEVGIFDRSNPYLYTNDARNVLDYLGVGYEYYWRIDKLNTANILSWMQPDYKFSWFVKNTFTEGTFDPITIKEIMAYNAPITGADNLSKMMKYLGLNIWFDSQNWDDDKIWID